MRIVFAIIVLLLSHAASASAPDAFDALKALEGTWSIESNGKPIKTQMTYAPGSKGSIVTEQFGHELSVFYRDGNALLMTHFCNAGNQPRLRLSPTSTAQTLEFDMIDITNLPTPATSHVHKIIYTLTDTHSLGLQIIWQTGAKEETETYRLTRM